MLAGHRPVLNGSNIEVDEPGERVLVHWVNVGQLGYWEEQNGRVLGNRPIALSRFLDLRLCLLRHLHTHRWQKLRRSTHPFNGHFSGTTQVGRYQKGKTNLDFTEARDSEWQWPLGHMQVCTSLQTDNHASTPPLSFLQAGCPSCRPALKAKKLRRM